MLTLHSCSVSVGSLFLLLVTSFRFPFLRAIPVVVIVLFYNYLFFIPYNLVYVAKLSMGIAHIWVWTPWNKGKKFLMKLTQKSLFFLNHGIISSTNTFFFQSPSGTKYNAYQDNCLNWTICLVIFVLLHFKYSNSLTILVLHVLPLYNIYYVVETHGPWVPNIPHIYSTMHNKSSK